VGVGKGRPSPRAPCKLRTAFMYGILAARSGWVSRAQRLTNGKQRKSMKKSGWMSRSFLLAWLCCALLSPGQANAQEKNSGDDSEAVVMAQEKPTVSPPAAQMPKPEQTDQAAITKTTTDEYSLSHDKYEKAIAYSRAGYTLYFVWVILGLLAVWVFLRFKV